MARALIIDDEKMVCDSIAAVLKGMGHAPVCACDRDQGLAKARAEGFEVVFLDVRLPDGSGLEILRELQGLPSSPEVIIITGFGDPDGAELAIKNGAWDYLEKPLSVREITLAFSRALQYAEEKKRASSSVHLKRKGIVGESAPISSCLDVVARAAGSDANVLIAGETGTGKELFAWAVHHNSKRANRNFVVVDCAALPETLVESVLFGHRKGAYTGADHSQEGLVKQADGGTLFLDEVGELPLAMQRSFLRVLQERRFRSVGEKQEVRSDFRLVAATNRDLEKMVKEGQFREDLLHRLRTLVINLPPLRDIPEDLEELVLFYVRKLCDKYRITIKGIAPGFMDVVRAYEWPGNTRELIQALERAIIAAQDDVTLFAQHLPHHIRISVARASVGRQTGRRTGPKSLDRGAGSPGDLPGLQEIREAAIAEAEKQYLIDLLALTGRDMRQACAISGLSRSRLYSLLKQYGVSRSR
ncbi:MAG: sigma-54-dependent Fis family transcriptional regulator [Candidatus Aminicenantes bacterium]|nr:sigma-54-dependent Fis family transcriptional regulator [Candidatus Aminicenantes bacterium]